MGLDDVASVVLGALRYGSSLLRIPHASFRPSFHYGNRDAPSFAATPGRTARCGRLRSSPAYTVEVRNRAAAIWRPSATPSSRASSCFTPRAQLSHRHGQASKPAAPLSR